MAERTDWHGVDKALVALIEEARRETACHCSGGGVVNRETCAQHGGAEANLVGRLTDALEASSVSAPPTITEQAVERAEFILRGGDDPWIEFEDGVVRAALRAALGGEA